MPTLTSLCPQTALTLYAQSQIAASLGLSLTTDYEAVRWLLSNATLACAMEAAQDGHRSVSRYFNAKNGVVEFAILAPKAQAFFKSFLRSQGHSLGRARLAIDKARGRGAQFHPSRSAPSPSSADPSTMPQCVVLKCDTLVVRSCTPAVAPRSRGGSPTPAARLLSPVDTESSCQNSCRAETHDIWIGPWLGNGYEVTLSGGADRG